MSAPDPLETSPLPERLAYFAGRLLGPDDLGAEQTYHRGRLALALRALVGHGTVAGLRVTAADGRLHVAPGVAIDCLGRLIEVRTPLCLDLAGWTVLLDTTQSNGRPLGEARVSDSLVLPPFSTLLLHSAQ